MCVNADSGNKLQSIAENAKIWNEWPKKSESLNALHCMAEKLKCKTGRIGSRTASPWEAKSWNTLSEKAQKREMLCINSTLEQKKHGPKSWELKCRGLNGKALRKLKEKKGIDCEHVHLKKMIDAWKKGTHLFDKLKFNHCRHGRCRWSLSLYTVWPKVYWRVLSIEV